MSRQSDVTERTIYRIERDARYRPRADTLGRLAEALDCLPSELDQGRQACAH